jgi:hypothetical protein
VAPCTFRGRLLGDPIAGQARLLTADDNARVTSLIVRKYRVQGWLVTLRARRRPSSTVSYAVTLAAGPDGS